MVVAVICCRSFCFSFVNFWSLEESRYVPESSCFACFDVFVGIAHAIFAVSRCSKMFLLNKSTVRPISPRVFVGFLIVEMPWKALSKAVWMIPLLSFWSSSAFGAGILKVSDAATSLLLSLLKLCSLLCSWILGFLISLSDKVLLHSFLLEVGGGEVIPLGKWRNLSTPLRAWWYVSGIAEDGLVVNSMGLLIELLSMWLLLIWVASWVAWMCSSVVVKLLK